MAPSDAARICRERIEALLADHDEGHLPPGPSRRSTHPTDWRVDDTGGDGTGTLGRAEVVAIPGARQRRPGEPMQSLRPTRSALRLLPDPRRVIAKSFVPGEQLLFDGTSRIDAVLRRILALPDDVVDATLDVGPGAVRLTPSRSRCRLRTEPGRDRATSRTARPARRRSGHRPPAALRGLLHPRVLDRGSRARQPVDRRRSGSVGSRRVGERPVRDESAGDRRGSPVVDRVPDRDRVSADGRRAARRAESDSP